MKKEIEITKLIHFFVRNEISEMDLAKLIGYLHEDPELLEFIKIDAIIYQEGIRRKKLRS